MRKIIKIENVMTCYCQAREAQALYTKCLDNENLTKVERELIYSLIQQTINQSSTVLNEYCKIASK